MPKEIAMFRQSGTFIVAASLITALVACQPTAPAGGDEHVGPSEPMSGSPASPGVDIVRDPSDLPAPVGKRDPKTVTFDLTAQEVVGQLTDGTTFTYMTFGGKVPGPFLRARVGDTIEIHLKNDTSSKLPHSIDLHAVNGPGGGSTVSQTKPGGESVFTFKALSPGIYVYHCATASVPFHMGSGMYGLILIEPEGGLPEVDKEFYVMQGEIYSSEPHGTQGALTFNALKLRDEQPDYFVFNGASGETALAGDQHSLKADVGDTVRVFF